MLPYNLGHAPVHYAVLCAETWGPVCIAWHSRSHRTLVTVQSDTKSHLPIKLFSNDLSRYSADLDTKSSI